MDKCKVCHGTGINAEIYLVEGIFDDVSKRTIRGAYDINFLLCDECRASQESHGDDSLSISLFSGEEVKPMVHIQASELEPFCQPILGALENMRGYLNRLGSWEIKNGDLSELDSVVVGAVNEAVCSFIRREKEKAEGK